MQQEGGGEKALLCYVFPVGFCVVPISTISPCENSLCLSMTALLKPFWLFKTAFFDSVFLLVY